MIVLAVDVDPDLFACWKGWLAPEIQPFFVESLDSWPKGVASPGPLPLELVDTYKVYRLDRPLKVLWLDEAAFLRMARSERAALVRSQVRYRRGAVPTVRRWQEVLDPAALRAQADGHRFVWWPSLLATNQFEILSAAVTEADVLPSRHAEVASETWDKCAEVLPGARELAGSFARSSGPNCFGTVMGAAGAEEADERVVIEPFLAWLDSACKRGGRDDEPGTVLVCATAMAYHIMQRSRSVTVGCWRNPRRSGPLPAASSASTKSCASTGHLACALSGIALFVPDPRLRPAPDSFHLDHIDDWSSPRGTSLRILVQPEGQVLRHPKVQGLALLVLRDHPGRKHSSCALMNRRTSDDDHPCCTFKRPHLWREQS